MIETYITAKIAGGLVGFGFTVGLFTGWFLGRESDAG